MSKSTFSNASSIGDFYRVTNDEYFRVNMVVSLDGNFAGPSGRSRDLSGPKDLSVLLTLRLLSDVVLVGARTAIGEKYRYTKVREDLQDIAESNPPFCLVTSSLEIPDEAPIFSDTEHRPVILTASSSDETWHSNHARLAAVADIYVSDSPYLDGVIIKDSLHKLGFKKILCEGGPKLLQTLFSSNVVDELDLTISPTIVGRPAPVGALGETLKRLELTSSVTDDDFIFGRYLFANADR